MQTVISRTHGLRLSADEIITRVRSLIGMLGRRWTADIQNGDRESFEVYIRQAPGHLTWRPELWHMTVGVEDQTPRTFEIRLWALSRRIEDESYGVRLGVVPPPGVSSDAHAEWLGILALRDVPRPFGDRWVAVPRKQWKPLIIAASHAGVTLQVQLRPAQGQRERGGRDEENVRRDAQAPSLRNVGQDRRDNYGR